MPNPFAALLHSRKFLLLMLDILVSGLTYFLTKYAAPEFATDALFLIGLIQPGFVAVIGAIAYEDNGQRRLDEAIMYQEAAEKERGLKSG